MNKPTDEQIVAAIACATKVHDRKNQREEGGMDSFVASFIAGRELRDCDLNSIKAPATVNNPQATIDRPTRAGR